MNAISHGGAQAAASGPAAQLPALSVIIPVRGDPRLLQASVASLLSGTGGGGD